MLKCAYAGCMRLAISQYAFLNPAVLLNQLEGAVKISMVVTIIMTTTFAVAAFSQAVPAAKESGKAVSETTKQAGDNIKAGTSSEPNKSVYKSKARVHKAKAHAHGHRAKADAKAAVQ